MKKCLFFILVAYFTFSGLTAQNFVLIDDPGNPINTVNLRGSYRGCAWADIDNDGDLDLTMLGAAFLNNGDDQFEQIPGFGTEGGTNDLPDVLGGVSWADYGNDGDLDCLYSTGSLFGGVASARTFIYENDGQANFTERLIDPDSTRSLKTWSASWGEFNNDGNVDVTGAVAFGFFQSILNTPGYFYIGNEDGSFTENTTAEFTQQTAPYTVAYWTDYDEDGDMDLFIASGPGGSPGPDFHYKNMLKESGTAQLVRITDEPFATDSQDGQNYNFIDYDLDGDLDLYLTNYGGAPNRFYRNDNGTYTAIQNTLTFGGTSLGNCWGDFDNDGDQDVLITADNLNQAGFYRNDDGTFTQMDNPFTEAFNTGNVSGLTIGDYDNDGDLDFFVNGGVSGANGNRGLFRNDLENGNSWVIFDTEANPDNSNSRTTLGTRFRLLATMDGEEVWLQREVTAQNTFMGHNSLRAHFGLGNVERIDSLIIEWPSGSIEHYGELPTNDIYEVIEGQAIVVNGLEVIGRKALNLKIYPNPANQSGVQVQNPFQEVRGDVWLNVINSNGQELKSLQVDTRQEWIQVDTTGLTDGMYYIQLINGIESATGKLFVE